MTLQDESLAIHAKYKGKLETHSKVPLVTRYDFSLAYTPGVAAVCEAIVKDKNAARTYTLKANTVAVISDGSAVLGLGNIGPEAAIPVMEGKAVIFKELAGIDAFPICLACQDVQTTIQTIRNIAPVFAGINLEDFKAPECFTIELALQDLGIPVMHDDQHGTAVVVLAGLINALKVASKAKEDVRVVINGVGAAGVAITNLLLTAGFSGPKMLLCDTKGIIHYGRDDLGTTLKADLSRVTNTDRKRGDLSAALKDADVFIGVSKGNLVTKTMVESMAPKPIVFALANPIPEISVDDAVAAGAAVVATGRSDYPNQVNNSLAFPGIFRGAIDCNATKITTNMKLAAGYALASLTAEPRKDEILPFATDRRIVAAVAQAVKDAWHAEQKHS